MGVGEPWMDLGCVGGWARAGVGCCWVGCVAFGVGALWVGGGGGRGGRVVAGWFV